MPAGGANVNEPPHSRERVQVDVADADVVCLRLTLRDHDAERVDDLRANVRTCEQITMTGPVTGPPD